MNTHYENFTAKIRTIEALRHYIDMEFSWLGAMVWGIVGISLYVHIGWWCLFVLYPIYRNLKLAIIFFIAIGKAVEQQNACKEKDYREEINK